MNASLRLLVVGILITLCACSPAVTATQGIPSETPNPSALSLPTITPIPSTSTQVPETATSTPTEVPPPTPTLLPYTTPKWFQNAVLYEIFVRSFADSNGDGVGDLKGITENLDYLDTLNVDVIWLLPIYPSPSVHGYDVIDYLEVNPDYGTLADLQELVNEVHARGMSIILDFVPSHLSNQNPLFEETYRDPEAERSDWFVWTNDAHTLYAGFAGNETMPRFNHFNPEVVSYLTEAALFWLDLDSDGDYTDGIDGFRVDNVTFPPQEFFITLRQGIKAANPDALLLGEAWVHTTSDLARYFENQFDALFDFPFYELLQGNQNSNGDGLLANKGFPALLGILMKEEAERYQDEQIAVRFLNNHDTNRIATELGGDPDRGRLAAALLASLKGPVMLYYGEEIGMLGQKGGPPHWDNYRREPMDWYAAEEGAGQATWFRPDDGWNQPGDGISVEEQDGAPGSLLTYYRQAFEVRQSSTALKMGDFTILDLEVSAPGPWGFLRTYEDSAVLALFNFAEEACEVTIADFPFTAAVMVDLLTGQVYPSAEAGGIHTLTLPPASALLLSAE